MTLPPTASAEEIEELRRGLEGVTPGPWLMEIEAPDRVDEADEDRQPEVYVCSPATSCDYTVVATMGRAEAIPHMCKSFDAAHIARCSPDRIARLLATLDATASDLAAEKAENERLRRAAEAEREATIKILRAHWRSSPIGGGDVSAVAVNCVLELVEAAIRARTALEASHER